MPFQGDLLTPVGVYLGLRDRYAGSLLLESTDYRPGENPYTFICANPLIGFQVSDHEYVYTRSGESIAMPRKDRAVVFEAFESFITSFQVTGDAESPGAGLFGYCSFDAVEIFESHSLSGRRQSPADIPCIHYQLFEFVLTFNHHRNETYIIHSIDGRSYTEEDQQRLDHFISQLYQAIPPALPFRRTDAGYAETSAEEHGAIIEQCKRHVHRGDVFQIVPSRRFAQPFEGDDFAVYRALRVINPSPYLFYFDFGDVRVFGSSPEAQLLTDGSEARVYPIAGTFPRGASEEEEEKIIAALEQDEKENAEHVMLVDLARNDLSTHCTEVAVKRFKEVHRYSHVLHLVSEVVGQMGDKKDVVSLLAATFPAGTLSGAPRYRAIELIDALEGKRRGMYGGAIGFFGFQGQSVHAIVIRSFVSRDFVLYRQAGGGIVADSQIQREVEEVDHKLAALERALERAESL